MRGHPFTRRRSPRDVAALQAHWERRLSEEGLGERSLFDQPINQNHRDPIVFVSIVRRRPWWADPDSQPGEWAEVVSMQVHGGQVAWHELAGAEVWQTIETQAQTLPVPDARELVTSLCLDGNLSAAARRVGISRDRARWLIAVANRHWRLLNARTAPRDRMSA